MPTPYHGSQQKKPKGTSLGSGQPVSGSSLPSFSCPSIDSPTLFPVSCPPLSIFRPPSRPTFFSPVRHARHCQSPPPSCPTLVIAPSVMPDIGNRPSVIPDIFNRESMAFPRQASTKEPDAVVSRSGNFIRFGTFSHQERTVHHPHFIHGNRKHDQKRDRHEHVAGQQSHHEEGRHVGNQPR